MTTSGATGVKVWATVFETYRTAIVRHRSALLAASAWPLGLSIAILFAEFALRGASVSSFSAWQRQTIGFGLGLLELLPYTLFAVAWHRVVLLGEHPATRPWDWRREHWHFLAYAAVFYVAFLLSDRLYVFLAQHTSLWIYTDGSNREAFANLKAVLLLASIPWTLLILGLWLRISLVYPGAAVQRRLSLVASWRHTKGQGLRMLSGYAIVCLPFFVLRHLIQTLGVVIVFRNLVSDTDVTPSDVATRSSQTAYVIDFLLVLLNYLLVVMSVTYVSLCFRRLLTKESR